MRVWASQRFSLTIHFVSLLTVASAMSCKPTPLLVVSDEVKALGMQYDAGFTNNEPQTIEQDFERLHLLKFSEKGDTRWVKAIFSGTDSVHILNYIGERVHYFEPINAELGKMVREPTNDATADVTEYETVASNVGAFIWFYSIGRLPAIVEFVFRGKNLPISSSRIGVVQLLSGFKVQGPPYAWIDRISAIVHEARHSDCTNGYSQQDVELMQKGLMPAHVECGHTHVECPAGHPYAGHVICDGHPWGAYAVESIFAAHLAQQCENCSQFEIQRARAISIERRMRVLISDAMLEGKLGEPNMTSYPGLNPDLRDIPLAGNGVQFKSLINPFISRN